MSTFKALSRDHPHFVILKIMLLLKKIDIRNYVKNEYI